MRAYFKAGWARCICLTFPLASAHSNSNLYTTCYPKPSLGHYSDHPSHCFPRLFASQSATRARLVYFIASTFTNAHKHFFCSVSNWSTSLAPHCCRLCFDSLLPAGCLDPATCKVFLYLIDYFFQQKASGQVLCFAQGLVLCWRTSSCESGKWQSGPWDQTVTKSQVKRVFFLHIFLLHRPQSKVVYFNDGNEQCSRVGLLRRFLILPGAEMKRLRWPPQPALRRRLFAFFRSSFVFSRNNVRHPK